MEAETQTAFEHKPEIWRRYKRGEISYRDYLAAGTYQIPANLGLRELMQYKMDTPRAADI